MKVKLVSMYKGPCIPIPYEILNELNLNIGDQLEMDVPMLGGGLRILKIEEQHVGDEVV